MLRGGCSTSSLVIEFSTRCTCCSTAKCSSFKVSVALDVFLQACGDLVGDVSAPRSGDGAGDIFHLCHLLDVSTQLWLHLLEVVSHHSDGLIQLLRAVLHLVGTLLHLGS